MLQVGCVITCFAFGRGRPPRINEDGSVGRTQVRAGAQSTRTHMSFIKRSPSLSTSTGVNHQATCRFASSRGVARRRRPLAVHSHPGSARGALPARLAQRRCPARLAQRRRETEVRRPYPAPGAARLGAPPAARSPPAWQRHRAPRPLLAGLSGRLLPSLP